MEAATCRLSSHRRIQESTNPQQALHSVRLLSSFLQVELVHATRVADIEARRYRGYHPLTQLCLKRGVWAQSRWPQSLPWSWPRVPKETTRLNSNGLNHICREYAPGILPTPAPGDKARRSPVRSVLVTLYTNRSQLINTGPPRLYLETSTSSPLALPCRFRMP